MVSIRFGLALLFLAGVAFSAPADLATQEELFADAQTQFQQQLPARPQIDWGKCPQLQPTDNERQQKALVIDQCLDKVPLPNLENATQEDVQKHREDVTTCALESEGWFAKDGTYKFEKAKGEIVNKKLAREVEPSVLGKHEECKKESLEKFPKQYVAQVQLYQACMDYHISQICGIQVVTPQGFDQGYGQPGGFPQQ